MKRLAIALVCTVGAFAAQANTYFDNARVRSAEPQYENVTVPRDECRNEWVTETQRVDNRGPNYGGVVLGALAGGVVGNQVARGNGGREAATALGALVGAMAGDRIAGRNNRYEQEQEVPRQVTRCQAVNEVQTRLTGYRVAYDYHGQTYTTMMREAPGPQLQVRVTVDPVGPDLR
ncbi:MAG: glycine zipper 2TM domain-containing protein [Rhodoferax sp.]